VFALKDPLARGWAYSWNVGRKVCRDVAAFIAWSSGVLDTNEVHRLHNALDYVLKLTGR
jgi:hypothetical protein